MKYVLVSLLVNFVIGLLVRAFIVKPRYVNNYSWWQEFRVFPVVVSCWPIALHVWAKRRTAP